MCKANETDPEDHFNIRGTVAVQFSSNAKKRGAISGLRSAMLEDKWSEDAVRGGMAKSQRNSMVFFFVLLDRLLDRLIE